MNATQIQDTLNTIFIEKKNRIIFWYDGDKEFEDILPSIKMDNVNIIRLDESSVLELKIRLECEDLTSRFILYAPFHEPAPEDDWLLDIRLYSYTFHADKASILLNELNLDNQSIRPHLKERNVFFRSKERLNKLKKWVNPNDREDDIDLKMLAVITRADQPDLFSILMKLFESLCHKHTFDETEPSRYWTEIEKLDLSPSFWRFVVQTFGYIHEKGAKLSDFIIRIFVTDFSNQLKGNLPASLEHFLIQSPSHAMNASVFLSQWRSNMNQFKHYNLISGVIAQKLKIQDLLSAFVVEDLLEVMSFEVVERRIISKLRDQIADNGISHYNDILAAIKIRLDGYWVSAFLNGEDRINLYKTVYSALETAIHLFNLREKYDEGFSYPSAEKMFKAYTSELFRFDQLYRKFSELADTAEIGGWDVLKSLRKKVESIYSGWFLDDISLKWGDFLEAKGGLLDTWKIPYICNQYDFFNRHLRPTLQESSRNRLFVIISDGFRYEVAEELMQDINGRYRLKAELAPMLGILPGYTALGMATLLPYKKLSFKEKSADILVDGKPAGALDLRSEILSQYHGTAIKAVDLTAMSKEQGREFVKPHRIIYIYHDQIDAVGDKAISESRTFEAARRAIDEISALINFIINNLNGTRVMITADHGFIYHDKPPTTIDRSVIDKSDKSHSDILKNHKRFVLGHNLIKAENTHWGSTRVTAHMETNMEFLLPKGTNRFSFIGGAKYYHGGAMLQEVVIPMLTVSEMKGKHLEKSEIKQVGISLIGSYKKIVTNISRFEFIQTDAVSERFKARTLKVSIRDGNDLISDEKMITFDSASSSIDERKKSVSQTLKTGQKFDNKKEYYLVLRNAEDDTEYDRISIMIDIAFASDF